MADQNPFLRLRHYKPGLIDPRENHATECLGLCMRVSEAIRKRVLRALFAGQNPRNISFGSACKIYTQHRAGRVGNIDLLIEFQNHVRIAIEAKIQSPEDTSQLQKYKDWIGKDGYIISLLRSQVKIFSGSTVDVRRVTWKELVSALNVHLEEYNSTDKLLVRYLTEYLEKQDALADDSSSSDTVQIHGAALEHIFTAIATSFGTPDFCILRDKRVPPHLEIGLPRWQRTFNDPYCRRLKITYMPQRWRRHAGESFHFIVVLWHKQLCSDWAGTSKRLKRWLPLLRSYHQRIIRDKGWHVDQVLLPPWSIASEPIFLYSESDPNYDYPMRDLGNSIPEITQGLVGIARRFVEIIDSLP